LPVAWRVRRVRRVRFEQTARSPPRCDPDASPLRFAAAAASPP
jgi:hypothetical protein